MSQTPASMLDGTPAGYRRAWPASVRLLVAGLALGGLWVVLAGVEDLTSWIIGLPAVIAAAWSHGKLARDEGIRLSPIGAVRLLVLFFQESFKGGIDVSLRVIKPRLDVDPGFVEYDLGLRLPSAQVLFVDLVSLLPGTLSADIQGERLRVHVLDRRVDATPDLVRLEQRIAALFGQDLAESGRPAW